MRLKVTLYVAGCVALMASTSIATGATRPRVVAATFAEYSVAPPTTNTVFVCHGFGCKYRVEIDLSAGDRAKLAQFLAAGRISAAAERKAVAAAGAWFDKRVGPVAGTANHVARAGMKYMYDIHQFDCIDTSRNTTSLLMVLDQLSCSAITMSMSRKRADTWSTGGRRMQPQCWSSGQPGRSGRSTPGPSVMGMRSRSCLWSAGRSSISPGPRPT